MKKAATVISTIIVAMDTEGVALVNKIVLALGSDEKLGKKVKNITQLPSITKNM